MLDQRSYVRDACIGTVFQPLVTSAHAYPALDIVLMIPPLQWRRAPARSSPRLAVVARLDRRVGRAGSRERRLVGLRGTRNVGRHLRRRRLRGAGADGPAHRGARREDGLGRDRERRREGGRRRSRSARRLVDALHARGVRVVAWYLPGHVKPALDLRRALAMLSFSTPTGGSFDGVALDIESTKLRNVGLRSQRAVALTRQLGRQRATCRSRSSRSTRAGSSGARPRGPAFRGPTWPRTPTRSRRWCTRVAV